MSYIREKRLIVLAAFWFFTFAFTGGCEGKKEELVQKNKAAESNGAVSEEEPLLEQETEEEEAPTPPKSITPPRVISARILPEAAYTNTDLRAEVEAEDRDDDLIDFAYQWIIIKESAAEDQGVNLEGENAPTLSHKKFVRGDALAVKITPSDWNSEGLTYQTKYTVIANSPPEIVSTPPETISDESLYTYQVRAMDPNDDPVTFSLGEGTPEGMTIDSATGLISWPLHPEITGDYTITVHGDDGHQGSCFQRFTLTLRSEEVSPEE